MFGLSNSRNLKYRPHYERVVPEEVQPIMEGVEILDSLLPVSSVTGNRMSFYDALRLVSSEKYSRQIDALMVEWPTVASDPRMSDDDRVDFLVSRLATGLPSEDDALREQLAKIVGDFSQVKPEVKTPDTIEFKSSDSPDASQDA